MGSEMCIRDRDNKSKFTIAIMHSAVATNLENLKLLKYMTQTDSNGIERQLTLATWNGRLVLIDDSMPTEEVAAVEESGTKGESGYVAAQEAYTKYTTFALGDGAFDYEDIGAKVPYEMYRNPMKNGGEDTLFMRQYLPHMEFLIQRKNRLQIRQQMQNLQMDLTGNLSTTEKLVKIRK